MPHPTRIADDIVADARAEAPSDGRSVAEQINYWARVGRNMTIHDSAMRRRIEAAAAGDLPIAELSRSEGRLFEAEAAVRLEDMLASTDLGAELSAAGVTTVSIDDEDRLIERRPDGTVRQLTRDTE
ncbi:TA system antitoxin ParD family protein [Tsukamurella ocularis]|uniref:TA system antitoxin ParD family protein n=1 Tax=Tsukamurella ocularis TaxID=1970234 RepID=UPI0039EEC11B